jgi:hypothetical protein
MINNSYRPFLSFAFFVMAIHVQAQMLSIDNTLPKKTMDGQVVDAHDGTIMQFGDRFYWYGTSYGNTNGFTTSNAFVCYSSSNLANWKFEGKILANKKEGVYYRPHVVYNKKNKQYVLWYNWYPKLWNGQFGVAVSNHPTGPFEVLNDSVIVQNSKVGVGDLSVFVDADETAYLSYNTIDGHKVSVEKLDAAYTASTLVNSGMIAEHCEAGSMFKRNSLYYLLTDETCCFCTQGSGARVYTSTTPLGPFTYQNNINRYSGRNTPILNDGLLFDNELETIFPKRAEKILVQLKKADLLKTITIIQHTADREGLCGIVDSPKVQQPILPATFSVELLDNGQWTKSNTENQFSITNSFITHTIVVKTKNKLTQAFRIVADSNYALSKLNLAEIVCNSPIYKTFIEGYGKPIIPAQQTCVLEINSKKKKQYIWIGDMWGSAIDNSKGHDIQYWSAPLEFDNKGKIAPLQWISKTKLKLN